MPFRLPFLGRLCIVDDRDQPVPIVPDVKDHVIIHIVGILKHAANFGKIMPTHGLDNAHPRCNFARRIWVFLDRLAQMLTRNEMHSPRILHIL